MSGFWRSLAICAAFWIAVLFAFFTAYPHVLKEEMAEINYNEWRKCQLADIKALTSSAGGFWLGFSLSIYAPYL
jgi:hypothetical protein